jgi:hypothetical protein
MQIPNESGTYIFLIRDPDSSRNESDFWVPIYVGKASESPLSIHQLPVRTAFTHCNTSFTLLHCAENLRTRFLAYINDDGSVGALNELKKHWRVLEAQGHGFDIQFR